MVASLAALYPLSSLPSSGLKKLPKLLFALEAKDVTAEPRLEPREVTVEPTFEPRELTLEVNEVTVEPTLFSTVEGREPVVADFTLPISPSYPLISEVLIGEGLPFTGLEASVATEAFNGAKYPNFIPLEINAEANNFAPEELDFKSEKIKCLKCLPYFFISCESKRLIFFINSFNFGERISISFSSFVGSNPVESKLYALFGLLQFDFFRIQSPSNCV